MTRAENLFEAARVAQDCGMWTVEPGDLGRSRRQPQRRRKGRPADEAAACDMAETGAAARHLGPGVARRAAHHARRAAEREQVGRAAA